MEFGCEKSRKNPIVGVDGLIESGTQFDLDIVLPEDDKSIIFGTIKDCKGCPIKDAVVALVEVGCKEGRKAVAHTFTNDCGEFLFGPLCEDKKYDIQIWVKNVKHVKICARPEHERECLQGSFLDKCDFIVGSDHSCEHRDFDECDCK